MRTFKQMRDDYDRGFSASYDFLNEMTHRIEEIGFGFVDMRVVRDIRVLENAAGLVRKVYDEQVAWSVIDELFRPIALQVYDMIEAMGE